MHFNMPHILPLHGEFYPRDAVLSLGSTISCLRLFVCLSHTHRYCIETAAQIEMVFAHVFPQLMLDCILRKLVYLLKKSTFLWNLFHILDFANVATTRRPSANRKRQRSIWCWQHLATTADVASAVSSRRSWFRSVYNAMVDWAWGTIARVHRRQLIIVR